MGKWSYSLIYYPQLALHKKWSFPLRISSFFDEILFSTRFSTTSSTIFIQPHIRKYKKIVYYYLSGQLLTQNQFYTKHLTLLLHFEKKLVLSIEDIFTNIDFLPNFYLFSQWIRCAIFQINTNLLII